MFTLPLPSVANPILSNQLEPPTDIFALTGMGTDSTAIAGLDGKLYHNGLNTWIKNVTTFASTVPVYTSDQADVVGEQMDDYQYATFSRNTGMHMKVSTDTVYGSEIAGLEFLASLTPTLWPSRNLYGPPSWQYQTIYNGPNTSTYSQFVSAYISDYNAHDGHSPIYDSDYITFRDTSRQTVLLFDSDNFEISLGFGVQGPDVINHFDVKQPFSGSTTTHAAGYARLRIEKQSVADTGAYRAKVSLVSRTGDVTYYISPEWDEGTAETASIFSRRGEYATPLYFEFYTQLGVKYNPGGSVPNQSFVLCQFGEFVLRPANNHGGHANEVRIRIYAHSPATPYYLKDNIDAYGGWRTAFDVSPGWSGVWFCPMNGATLDDGIWTLRDTDHLDFSSEPVGLQGYNIIPDNDNVGTTTLSPYLILSTG